MNGEEVDRNHAAAVIAKGSFPVAERGATSTRYHILGDSSLRDNDTELEQLALNPGSNVSIRSPAGPRISIGLRSSSTIAPKTGHNLLLDFRQCAVLCSTLFQVI